MTNYELQMKVRHGRPRFKWGRGAFLATVAALSLVTYHSSLLFGQQPQAPAGTPLYSVNAKYVNGMAPGYWATAGSGLVLNLSAGTAYCGNPPVPVSYPGGSLTLTASTTNYVYLDPAQNCSPVADTSAFAAGEVPLATVVTGATSITSVTDARTWFSPQPCATSSAGAVHCSASGSNQSITLTPSGTGGVVIANLQDNGGQVFNVKAYGAKGNGTSDDTASIESAEAAAEAVHGVVYFPPGIYLVTSTLNINKTVRWEGAFSSANDNGSGGPESTSVILAGAALNPIVNIGAPGSEIDHLRIDGNAEAIEGVRTRAGSGYPRDYNVVMKDDDIQNFPMNNPSVIALDLGDYTNTTNQYACADCVFYDVAVGATPGNISTGKAEGWGVYISREENQFFDLKVGSWKYGIVLGGGSSGGASDNAFYGGSIADDSTADITISSDATTSANLHNSWYNIWFEGSGGPIVGGIPSGGSPIDEEFFFYSCHFNTYASTSIFDLTNLVGSVTSYNSTFDISNSGNVIVPGPGWFNMYQDSFVSSLTFTGNYHSANGVLKGSISIPANAVAANSCGPKLNGTAATGVTSASPIGLSSSNWYGLIATTIASTNEVQVQLCNPTTSSITPGSGTLYWTAGP